MKTKPPDIRYEPILCPHCLHEGRAQRLWVDLTSLTLACSAHGDIFAIQEFDDQHS